MSPKMCTESWNAVLVKIMLLGLLLQSSKCHAASYTVGGSNGWAFNVAGWENGKNFKAADTLVFKYSSSAHNVAVVDKSGYDSCSAPANARTSSSGNDQIKLRKGANYFICTFPGHCSSGMKIAAIAA